MTSTIRPSQISAAISRRQATEAATDAERIRAALALHQSNNKRKPRCIEDDHAWPCRTARILKGE